MCDPVTLSITMAGLAAAQAGTQVMQEKEQQKMQIKAQENQAKAEIINYNFDQKNLENEMISNRDATENEFFESTIKNAEMRSTLASQASETGITGNTLAASDQALNALFGRESNVADRNYDILAQSGQSRSDAGYNSLTSTLNGLSGSVSGPGVLDSTLKIAAAGVGGYASGQSMSKNK